MTATVRVQGAVVPLAAEDAIATGGEATVYAAGARAIKIWHQPSRARAAKVTALLGRRAALPRALVAPEALVHDAASGDAVGFVMPRLVGSWEPIALLGLPTWRQARGLGLAAVGPLMAALFDAVEELHAAGIVVGDLSDQNVLVAPGEGAPVRLVDADSVQIDGLPCAVATEAFLDPHLYGPDLAAPCATAGGAARTFDEASDRYALLALLFRLMTRVHPYGGSLDRLPTLPRRAAARTSVMRPEVTVPGRVREAIDLVPRDLRSVFAATFERGERPALPRDEVAAWASSLLTCGCGLEIPAEHLPCPHCASASRRVAVTGASGGAAEVVLEARGPFVAVAAGADVVVGVALERGVPILHVVRAGRRERHVVVADASPAGWDVALSPALVAVAARGGDGVAAVHLLAIRRGGVVRGETSTERARGVAAMAVADDVLFRVARGTVLAGRLESDGVVERAVTTVMTRQTRLAGVALGGAPAAVALGQVLGTPQWTLIARTAAVSLEAPVLASAEAIGDAAATGDGEGVVVLLRTRLAGRELVRIARYDAKGRRTSERAVAADARAAGSLLEALGQRGRLVQATDGGLVREDVVSGAATRFAATEPFVERGAAIAAAPGGVLVAQGRVVRLLRAS